MAVNMYEAKCGVIVRPAQFQCGGDCVFAQRLADDGEPLLIPKGLAVPDRRAAAGSDIPGIGHLAPA
jgi:hypothetical protein